MWVLVGVGVGVGVGVLVGMAEVGVAVERVDVGMAVVVEVEGVVGMEVALTPELVAEAAQTASCKHDRRF